MNENECEVITQEYFICSHCGSYLTADEDSGVEGYCWDCLEEDDHRFEQQMKENKW
jgi:hypothetical protein